MPFMSLNNPSVERLLNLRSRSRPFSKLVILDSPSSGLQSVGCVCVCGGGGGGGGGGGVGDSYTHTQGYGG